MCSAVRADNRAFLRRSLVDRDGLGAASQATPQGQPAIRQGPDRRPTSACVKPGQPRTSAHLLPLPLAPILPPSLPLVLLFSLSPSLPIFIYSSIPPFFLPPFLPPSLPPLCIPHSLLPPCSPQHTHNPNPPTAMLQIAQAPATAAPGQVRDRHGRMERRWAKPFLPPAL